VVKAENTISIAKYNFVSNFHEHIVVFFFESNIKIINFTAYESLNIKFFYLKKRYRKLKFKKDRKLEDWI